jgi:hypothetical protein
MDSSVPFTPSFTATPPMMPPHFMGTNPSIFYNGMHDYKTQSTPWVSHHFSIDMPSHVKPPPWSTYMNPSIGSGGTIAPMPTSSFDMNHFPMGGWNLPPYGSNPSYALLGSSAQMGILLHPAHVSFICHVGPFKHIFCTRSSSTPRSSVLGESIL